ncbi:hypothetical protein [Polaribacter sp. 11A2H]|uniref:hypothetical protein n=1 Tax=Polaribacter sp. 11A2H TaxID=2687290 RepID=UPI00140CA343|nr:hypothetical protein [Polaribacter sp. 11A2H]
MSYTLKVWLFTIITSPLLLAFISVDFINDSSLDSILNSFKITFMMMLFGAVLSVPTMVVFWWIQSSLNAKLPIWKHKTILSIYSLTAICATFYVVDYRSVTSFSERTSGILIAAVTIVLAIWFFNYNKLKQLNNE